MSYSFSVTADSKADAKQKISDEFDNVVNGQPSHAADRAAAVACARSFVDTLAEPDDTNEIYVNVSGSLGWRHDVPDNFLHASISVNASLRSKEQTVK